MIRTIIYTFLLLITTAFCFAQNAVQQGTFQQTSQKIIQESKKLQKAYDANDKYAIAKSYEEIGNDYYKNLDYAKAEDNFSKAKAIYIQLNKNEDKIRVSRLLAKSQEAQDKIEEAIKNYEDAGDVVEPNSTQASKSFSKDDNTNTALNFNDASRLKNPNLTEQEKLLKRNIEILAKAKEKPENTDDLTYSYNQLAQVQMQQKKVPEAIENYSNAFVNSKTPQKIIANGNLLSNAYANTGKYDKAIEVQQTILTTPEIQNDPSLKIAQTQNLANIYTQKEDVENAMVLLKQSYDLAIQNNKTIDAKNSLEAMVKILNDKGNTGKSIELYQQFLRALESLIQKDSSLTDSKIILATEERINQLEKEKALKDQLIRKKNTFSYFLIAAAALLSVLLLFIGRSLYSIKIKNKKIELQSLRREMNPHFVFNSLNSINQFIAQNNELEANKYLTSYSNLMRSMMENSNKDFISLSTELELIKRYLDLEKLRFTDKFDYQISVDELIDIDAVQIPNMLIQPHLENAIWHGLRYKETKGNLLVNFLLHDSKVTVKIEDDGIGLSQSKALKTKNQQSHTSIGISNTHNRIALLNELYNKDIECKINELQAPKTGTIIEISFNV